VFHEIDRFLKCGGVCGNADDHGDSNKRLSSALKVVSPSGIISLLGAIMFWTGQSCGGD